MLESTQPDQFAEEAQTFLSRLSDHAAIAISNAQLYAEVQQANIAKSEFVSFVAHELKNPMTSIKGYSELLAAGAVGSINDMQSNFLSTIRTNIERMKTIVDGPERQLQDRSRPPAPGIQGGGRSPKSWTMSSARREARSRKRSRPSKSSSSPTCRRSGRTAPA